jgi:hypothetical protein
MKGRVGLTLIGFAALVVVLLFVRRGPVAQRSESNAHRGGGRADLATNVPAQTTPGASTNAVEVPAVFLTEVNKFIVAAQPYGLDGPIAAGNVIGVSDDQRRFMLETKTHLADFFTKGRKIPQLHHFIATQDASNPVAEPEAKREAMKKWYLATAPWTEQEALAETHKILERLGIRTTWDTQEAKPASIVVKNPQGQDVQVTPFYNVKLKGAKGTIMAEFRMGQSGPGRLTEWFAVFSADVQQ